MATHRTFCVVCAREVLCSDDVSALGCGGARGEGGCNNPPYIEFCSLDHAEELHRRLRVAIENYKEMQASEERK